MDFFSFACSFSLSCREVSSGDQVGWWAEGKFQKALCPLLKHLDFILRGGSHCLHRSCRGFVKQYVSMTWSAHLMCVNGREPKADVVRPGDVERKRNESMARIAQQLTGPGDCIWEVKDVFN